MRTSALTGEGRGSNSLRSRYRGWPRVEEIFLPGLQNKNKPGVKTVQDILDFLDHGKC